MYVLLVRDESKKPRTTGALERMHDSSKTITKQYLWIIIDVYECIQMLVLTTNEGNIYRRSHMTRVYTLITWPKSPNENRLKPYYIHPLLYSCLPLSTIKSDLSKKERRKERKKEVYLNPPFNATEPAASIALQLSHNTKTETTNQ